MSGRGIWKFLIEIQYTVHGPVCGRGEGGEASDQKLNLICVNVFLCMSAFLQMVSSIDFKSSFHSDAEGKKAEAFHALLLQSLFLFSSISHS